MSEGRKQITLEELDKTIKRTGTGILKDLEVEAKVIVRDKNGNIKQDLTLNEVIHDED